MPEVTAFFWITRKAKFGSLNLGFGRATLVIIALLAFAATGRRMSSKHC